MLQSTARMFFLTFPTLLGGLTYYIPITKLP